MKGFRKTSSAKIPCMNWRSCIAKTDENGNPGLSVLDHCRIVGEVSRALLDHIAPTVTDLLGENPALVAALHDIGKASPGFQKKCWGSHLLDTAPELAKYHGAMEELHARVSEAALNSYMDARFASAPIAAIAGIHHGDRDKPAPMEIKMASLGGRSGQNSAGN